MAAGLQRQDAVNYQGDSAASRSSMILALVLITGIMVAEIIGGALSGSLALLADAGHMLAIGSAIAVRCLRLGPKAAPHPSNAPLATTGRR